MKYIIIILIFCGCTSVEKPKESRIKSVNEVSYDKIEVVYQNGATCIVRRVK